MGGGAFYHPTPKGLCELKGNESYQGDCTCEEEHFIIQLLRGFVYWKEISLTKEIVYVRRLTTFVY